LVKELKGDFRRMVYFKYKNTLICGISIRNNFARSEKWYNRGFLKNITAMTYSTTG